MKLLKFILWQKDLKVSGSQTHFLLLISYDAYNMSHTVQIQVWPQIKGSSSLVGAWGDALDRIFLHAQNQFESINDS